MTDNGRRRPSARRKTSPTGKHWYPTSRRSIEIMDINRNALRKRMERSLQSKVDQLTRLVGDESWKEAGYREG